MPTKLKPLPISQSANGYITLEQLTKITPAEDDITIDGHKFRVRGLHSGELQQVRNLCSRPPAAGGYDGLLNVIYNVAFGLVRPDLKAHEDLTAARLIAEGLPPPLLAQLSDRIADLTNQTDAPSIAEPGGDVGGDADADHGDRPETGLGVDLDDLHG